MLSMRVVVVVVVGSGEVQPCLVVGSTPQLRLVTRPVNIDCSDDSQYNFVQKILIYILVIN